MASMTIRGTQEFEIALNRLGESADDIAKKAVWEAAQPVADEIRSGLERNLNGSKYSHGDLKNSLGITKPDIDNNGVVNVKIGFHGYDRKGVSNKLKARAMESGTSKKEKRPFVRPALNKTKKHALKIMQEIIDKESERIMK